jgi:putative endonuclease
MYYVYVLKDKRTSQLYIGYTENLKRRLSEHKKNDACIDLIYYEAYIYKEQARLRERKLKLYGSAWRGLKETITTVMIRGLGFFYPPNVRRHANEKNILVMSQLN